MQSTGRLQQGGRLAVSKEDFNDHWRSGEAFRHTAGQIDMSPQIPGVGGATVQLTLENLTDIITSAGSGFISIGQVDGYSTGIYNAGTDATPTFTDAFNAAQADDRLINGGIIMIMAGSYTITTPITVNPGITIIGELGGTYLIGETTEQSMFIVSSSTKDIQVGGDSGSGDVDIISGTNVDKVKFYNLIMFDNLNENVGSGSSMITVPMISLKQGGNLECEQVSFFGKINDGAITNRSKTKCTIGTISGVSAATSLIVKNCFFDGMRNGIIFTPQAGDLDFLSVTNCKARFFGKESAAYTAAEDSFIYASLCVANVSNNYVMAGHANAKTLINFRTTGGTTTNIRVVVNGNFGNISVSSAFLIDNDSAVTFNSAISNNNWGINTGNPWFITVGGSDGDNPIGDIFGPNAINTIISWSNALGLEATVIVNPGTYTVTASSSAASNVANLKFIGNKKGRAYPIFQLNIGSSSTDNIGNRFLVLGNHLESIYFTSITTFQSIRPSFNPIGISSQNGAHLITIKDCIFVNTACNTLDVTTAILDQLGNITSINVVVENCHFDQTGVFDDNISLVVGPAHLVNVKNCNFFGNGYAFNIGQESYGTTAGIFSNYIFENVLVDCTGSITAASPGSLTTNKRCIVKDSNGSLTMKNCDILVDHNAGPYQAVSAALLNADSFEAYIYLDILKVNLLNCYFSGPNQNFVSSGTTYALPAVQITGVDSVIVDNCKFHSGGLPLQIKSTAPDDTYGSSGITISKSSFKSVIDDSGTTITMLDLDVERTGSATSGAVEVNISGCNFLLNDSIAAGAQVKHTNVTGANYNAHGIVQIYCRGVDLNFSNNRIFGPLYAPTVNPYTHISGLVINTYSSDAGNIGWPTSCIVTNNNIKIHSNNFSIANAVSTASCAHVRTTVGVINNNVFEFANSASILASFAGCLALDIRAFVSGLTSAGDCTVSSNSFGNHTTTGTLSALSRGFITIASTTTTRGKITNNSFSNTTFDGVSNTALVESGLVSTSYTWLIAYNKNQTKTITARGNYGQLGLKNSANTIYTASGDVPNVAASSVGFVNGIGTAVQFDYVDTADETALWTIPLCGLVPEGAYVTKVSVTVDIDTVTLVDTRSCSLIYKDTTSSSTPDTISPLTTAGSTLTLNFTLSSQRIVTAELAPCVELSMRILSSAGTDVQCVASYMTITYRW